jgi:hypothetical protein
MPSYQALVLNSKPMHILSDRFRRSLGFSEWPAGILGGLAGRIGPCRRGGSVRDRWPASPLNQRGGWRLVARTKKPRRSGVKFSKGEPASSGGEHDGRPPNAEPQSWLHGAGAARRSGGDHMERPSEHCRADYMTIVMSRRPPAATKPTPELEKAERGMAMPYDAERVGQLRKMFVEARKRKLSEGLAKRRRLYGRHEG